jgi:cytidylate kinase
MAHVSGYLLSAHWDVRVEEVISVSQGRHIMAIITISRGSYCCGKAVAEEVAERLGYQCIARDIIVEACKEFNVPEVKLVRAIHDAPSLLERFMHGRERYLAYFQSALLKHLKDDNAVYHGLAGQFCLPGISHVLKVRVVADMENRIRCEMERGKIGREEAQRTLEKDDEERRKWSMYLFGVNIRDPNLYDLVVNTEHVPIPLAAELICDVAQTKPFQTTSESQKAMDDLALAAQVKAALVNVKPDINVSVKNHVALLRARHVNPREEAELSRLAREIPGIKLARVEPREISTRFG